MFHGRDNRSSSPQPGAVYSLIALTVGELYFPLVGACTVPVCSLSPCSVFENLMRTVQLNSLHVPKGKTSTPVSSHLYQHYFHKRCDDVHSRTCCSSRLPALLSSLPESLDRGACGDEVEDREEDKTYLPLLVKLQGAFKEPEKVWRQRVKPLEPTLRTATPYNSVEIARSANYLYIGISDFM